MIRFGLRLAVAGGREALTRLVIIAAAVALGVGLLLATLAGVNARQRADHPVRLAVPQTPVDAAGGDAGSAVVVDCGRTTSTASRSSGSTSPRPARARRSRRASRRLPGPGEYYASPALRDAAGRHPGRPARRPLPRRELGTIGPAALPAPDALLVIVGRTPDEVAALPGADAGHQHRRDPATAPAAAPASTPTA